MTGLSLTPHTSAGGRVTSAAGGGSRLAIPPGPVNGYRLAQLENYWGRARRHFPSRPPLTLSLRARVSSSSVPGTWGFGFWNDPFPSFGFGPYPPAGPVLPNALWFFFASPKNHLSFRDDKPAQGFIAQAFRSPAFHPSLLQALLLLPFSRKRVRRILGRLIEEDSAAVAVATEQWHHYRLVWNPTGCVLQVDEQNVLSVSFSPRPPLGLVIWIDNQYAAFTREGRLRWGLEATPNETWLEIRDLELVDQDRAAAVTSPASSA